MTSLRVFLIGGVMSYRALFNWIRPTMYVSSMLGAPLVQLLFFAYVGRYTGGPSDRFYLLGNGTQACGMAAIFAGTMTVANERRFGTLSAILATPASRTALFFGRAVPVVLNGLLVSVVTIAAGSLLLGASLPARALGPIALVLCLSVASCTGFGLLMGSAGLRARDIFLVANLAYFVMLLFCGVDVPVHVLPPWMRLAGSFLPLTHGIAAARAVADGASLGAVGGLLAREAAVGLGYAVGAIALFALCERQGRRSGTFDAY